MAGDQPARRLAVAVIGLNVIGQMLFIPAYPSRSLMIITVDTVACYGRCARGGRLDVTA